MNSDWHNTTDTTWLRSRILTRIKPQDFIDDLITNDVKKINVVSQYIRQEEENCCSLFNHSNRPFLVVIAFPSVPHTIYCVLGHIVTDFTRSWTFVTRPWSQLSQTLPSKTWRYTNLTNITTSLSRSLIYVLGKQ